MADYEDYEDYPKITRTTPPLRRPAESRRLAGPANPNRNQKKQPSRARSRESGDTPSTVIGGIVAMVIAVVWFVAGLAGGVIFFYPPVMFVLGLVSVFSALFNRD